LDAAGKVKARERLLVVIAVKNVHTFYGKSHVLHGVSLGVPERSVIALSGRNGVGKTTTLRSIIGFSRPEQGSIDFNGTNIAGLPAYAITRMGIALVPQGRRLFTSLSVKENLDVAAHKSRKAEDGWDHDKIFSLFPVLYERRNMYAGSLSGGEMQMLAIARALMANPVLLLMDEPTEGLAPLLVREIKNVLRKLKDEKKTSILLVEQNYQMVLDLADYIYVMSKGAIVYESKPEELASNEAIKGKYLGVGKR
jgi:branched-chain amino acid transport system ATP-binding protein